jgi:hypothetical protein
MADDTAANAAASMHREILAATGPWLRYVTETGHHAIPELLADRTPVQHDPPRAMTAAVVKAQVYLLARLRSNGLLAEPGPAPPEHRSEWRAQSVGTATSPYPDDFPARDVADPEGRL